MQDGILQLRDEDIRGYRMGTQGMQDGKVRDAGLGCSGCSLGI